MSVQDRRVMPPIEWRNDHVLEFIHNYELEPILWNSKHPHHKKKHLVNAAWVRIKNNLSWRTTFEEMKRKKDSLMACYRTIINKMRKSIRNGQDLYQTSWFAFEALDRFLGPIYDWHQIPIEDDNFGDMNEDSSMEFQFDNEIDSKIDIEEHLEGGKQIEKDIFVEFIDLNKVPGSSNSERINEEISNNIGTEVPNTTRNTEYLKRKRRRYDERIDSTTAGSDDEYEMFGKFIATKIKKLKNENVRDIVMNDVHNLVVRACMADRQQSRYSTHYPEPFSQASQTAFYQFLSTPYGSKTANYSKSGNNVRLKAQDDTQEDVGDMNDTSDGKGQFEEVLLLEEN